MFLFFVLAIVVILLCNFVFIFVCLFCCCCGCCFSRDILLNTLLIEEKMFSSLSMILVNLPQTYALRD